MDPSEIQITITLTITEFQRRALARFLGNDGMASLVDCKRAMRANWQGFVEDLTADFDPDSPLEEEN